MRNSFWMSSSASLYGFLVAHLAWKKEKKDRFSVFSFLVFLTFTFSKGCGWLFAKLQLILQPWQRVHSKFSPETS